ncbi:MAG: molybdenum cofactor biosynthesis protein MoaE [Saezia sp.]
MKISVQTQDFDLNAQCCQLLATQTEAGAVVSFVGCVRAQGQNPESYWLELEYYPGMTEKAIAGIVKEAMSRFGLLDVTVIHRVGRLSVGDQIVMVAVISAHRKAAFDGCEFVMDYLKTQAPFWKRENSPLFSGWVDAKESDDNALRRWGVVSENAGQ